MTAVIVFCSIVLAFPVCRESRYWEFDWIDADWEIIIYAKVVYFIILNANNARKKRGTLGRISSFFDYHRRVLLICILWFVVAQGWFRRWIWKVNCHCEDRPGFKTSLHNTPTFYQKHQNASKKVKVLLMRVGKINLKYDSELFCETKHFKVFQVSLIYYFKPFLVILSSFKHSLKASQEQFSNIMRIVPLIPFLTSIQYEAQKS